MCDRLLVPVPVEAGVGVLALLAPLRDALNGVGPALLPYDVDQAPHPALRPGEPLDADEDDPHDPTVAVTSTSGSTGVPKGALLSASALLASASATHDRLGGPGTWLLALRGHHVAGLQVLLRSLVARTTPTVLDLSQGFAPEAFAEAAASTAARTTAGSPGGRRYTSLVPTQLARLLEAGGGPLAALAGFDAVLVGGAAAASTLLDRARAAGVRLVTTYGMSETCGGCVYDGRPLDGVQVRVDDDGRVHLGGPVVARGYRRAAAGSVGAGSAEAGSVGAWSAFRQDGDGTRWFRTDDAGRLTDDGRLTVLGRLDDAVTTGGLTVVPAVVEAVLHTLPGVAEAVVVGAPDATWGQRVVAVLVLSPGATAPTLAQARALVGERLEAAAAPRQLLVLERLPLRGPGKPDRTELGRLAALADRG